MPTSPLITYLRIQQATDRQVLAALRTSATSVSAELKRLQSRSGTGTAVRREQLLRSQVAINQELGVLYTRVGDIVKAQSAVAAAAGAESILSQSQSLLQNVLSKADYDYLVRSARASAANSLEVLRQRVSGSSYVPLADSVWGAQKRANSQVNNIINSALARGASAAELAKEVRGFVDPNTPGGVRYASMRLARTELNNAFHAAQVKQAQEEPWTLAVRWHLSGSHPKPDECNQYAENEHFEGGGAGLWKPEEVPGKPHPNCLCYTTPETDDPDVFIDKYLKGQYDPYLEEQGLELETAPPVPAPAPRAKSNIARVGSNELQSRMLAAERQRVDLEKARYIQKGRGKGNYNPETGYDVRGAASARQQYTEMANRDMNALLRDPVEFASRSNVDDWWVEAIDEQNKLLTDLMSKNALSEDVTVARHMTGKFGDLVDGDYMSDPGFLSTTTDLQAFLSKPSMAFEEAVAAGEESWTFIIQAPKGTNALPGADWQKEIFFGPGTKQRILYTDKESRTIYTEIVS